MITKDQEYGWHQNPQGVGMPTNRNNQMRQYGTANDGNHEPAPISSDRDIEDGHDEDKDGSKIDNRKEVR